VMPPCPPLFYSLEFFRHITGNVHVIHYLFALQTGAPGSPTGTLILHSSATTHLHLSALQLRMPASASLVVNKRLHGSYIHVSRNLHTNAHPKGMAIHFTCCSLAIQSQKTRTTVLQYLADGQTHLGVFCHAQCHARPPRTGRVGGQSTAGLASRRGDRRPGNRSARTCKITPSMIVLTAADSAGLISPTHQKPIVHPGVYTGAQSYQAPNGLVLAYLVLFLQSYKGIRDISGIKLIGTLSQPSLDLHHTLRSTVERIKNTTPKARARGRRPWNSCWRRFHPHKSQRHWILAR
jgi:hypothetical protein